MDNAVTIVTIKEKIPLYKGTDVASKVELVTFEENGFHVVSQKNLYTTGDLAVFIIPDYCISYIPLFEEFIAPNGDPSKSYLGKVGGIPKRIRAKKFTLSTEESGLPIYSNGILLPLKEVSLYLKTTPEAILKRQSTNPGWLTVELGITKYEEPEEAVNQHGLTVKGGKPFPSGVYKTDETNINLLWSHIEKQLCYPIVLRGTEKIDGSSITIGVTDEYPKGFIASRNLLKPLTIKKVIGRREKTFLERLKFWKKYDLNLYEESENTDDFVKYGKKYLDLMLQVGLHNVILRGELNGGSIKGSGNKNNPASGKEPNILFFNADTFNNGVAVKMEALDFIELCNKWGIPGVPHCFTVEFSSREDIENECAKYFEQCKKNKRIIEGIVLSTLDNTFSAKFMNDEYDSKK